MATTIQSQTGSMHQIVRLLQIGIVLEEIAEARAAKHARDAGGIDSDVQSYLEAAASDTARHRTRVEELLDRLDADTVPFDRIERLVDEQYDAEQDTDGVLYDQLCSEETAFKLYDDLITVIRAADIEHGIQRDQLLAELESLRAEEAADVRAVVEFMQQEDE